MIKLNKNKALKYLKEGTLMFSLSYFIYSFLFIYFVRSKVYNISENILLTFIGYVMYGLFGIPIAAFFSYKIDKIIKKVKISALKLEFKKGYKYLFLKMLLGVSIFLLPFLLIYTPASEDLSLYMSSLLSNVIKVKDMSFINIFIVMFFVPFICISLFAYLAEKALGFYYKNKSLKISEN